MSISQSEELLGTVERFAQQLGYVLEPLIEAYNDRPEGILVLLDEIGIKEVLTNNELTIITKSIEDGIEPRKSTVLETLFESNRPPDLDNLLKAVDSVYGTIAELDSLQFDGVDSIGELLLDYLLVSYLEEHHRTLHNICVLLSVISTEGGQSSIDLSALPKAIANPIEIPKELLDWADDRANFQAFLLLFYLKDSFWNLGIPASLDGPSDQQIEDLTDVDLTDLEAMDSIDYQFELQVPLLLLSGTGGRFLVGFKLVPLPGDSDHLPGLAVVTIGQLEANKPWALGDGWTFNVRSNGELGEQGFGVRPKRTGGVQARSVAFGDNQAPDHLQATGEIKYDSSVDDSSSERDDESTETVLLGTPEGSRLAVNSIGARVTLQFQRDTELVIEVEVPMKGVVGIHPSDFDGFLGEIMPSDGLLHDFDVIIGWSSARGLYLGSGDGLSTTIPHHLSLGPLSLNEVHLEADPDVNTDILSTYGAVSVGTSLGPVSAIVEQLGIAGDVAFPDQIGGNLGLLNLDIGFRPPNGIGLSVDAGPVAGGGFLDFYPDEHRYVGAFELQVYDYTIKIVGLLTTELPGGREGYSLLLIITGDLPPIQLGFGFTLNGLGGLIGVHRAFESKPLGDAVRSGSLDSILFPDDVIENANQIVTDLQSIFPPRPDVHVFGPMARFTWGAPTVLRMDVGILVSIPTWKIGLLGKILLQLPDEEVALVDLKLAVAGVLDVPGEEVSIDASLYDSRVAGFSLSGDMALRSNWGDDPRFIVSVGGFHPRYTPPTAFPELRRVTASLTEGRNPRLEMTGYLAVTSNTFQVGAGLVLQAKAGPAEVNGQLSFDALFQFDPFKFIVDFFAKLRFTVWGKGFTISVDGNLSGPGPYRVRGKVYIEFLFWDVTIPVDVKIGPSPKAPPLPVARVLPKLAAALDQTPNWSAQQPTADSSFVTLRDLAKEGDENAPSSDRVLAHPLGTLSVRQKVVPLKTDIEKFGNARPEFTRFSITKLHVEQDTSGASGNLSDEPGLNQLSLRENFAPAQFREMPDSEKLQAPAFESLPAGRSIANGAIRYAGQNDPTLVKSADLSYEVSVIDQENDIYQLRESDLDPEATDGWVTRLNVTVANELANASAVATAATRTTGAAKFHVERDGISVSDQRYVVVWNETLERVSVGGEDLNPPEGQTRIEAHDLRKQFVSDHSEHRESVRVVGVHESPANGRIN